MTDLLNGFIADTRRDLEHAPVPVRDLEEVERRVDDALNGASDLLAPFAADARASVEQAARERRLQGIPQVPLAEAAPRDRRASWFAGVAAVLLAGGTYLVVDREEAALERTAVLDQAQHDLEVDAARAGALRRNVRPRAVQPRTGLVEETPAEEVPEAGLSGDAGIEAPGTRSPPAPRVSPRGHDVVADSPGDVDGDDRDDRDDRAEAEAAWASGETAKAERLFRAIIARAPSSREADLAWGDLFVLARQLHGPDEEYRRWGEYLAEFPRGRHADDARAGRCRRAPSDGGACWQQYLEAFPQGAHVRAAHRVLQDASE